jgi:hypothetical protein
LLLVDAMLPMLPLLLAKKMACAKLEIPRNCVVLLNRGV